MNTPLVSICIPAYNIEEYLSQTIESVTKQTYNKIEVIIVDDGSTDKSLEIAKGYESEKIKVYSQENKGASAARNTAFRYSKGDFIKFLDADDLINPEMIESQIKLALENYCCRL